MLWAMDRRPVDSVSDFDDYWAAAGTSIPVSLAAREILAASDPLALWVDRVQIFRTGFTFTVTAMRSHDVVLATPVLDLGASEHLPLSLDVEADPLFVSVQIGDLLAESRDESLLRVGNSSTQSKATATLWVSGLPTRDVTVTVVGLGSEWSVSLDVKNWIASAGGVVTPFRT
jgi:hypothetical protein